LEPEARRTAKGGDIRSDRVDQLDGERRVVQGRVKRARLLLQRGSVVMQIATDLPCVSKARRVEVANDSLAVLPGSSPAVPCLRPIWEVPSKDELKALLPPRRKQIADGERTRTRSLGIPHHESCLAQKYVIGVRRFHLPHPRLEPINPA